MNDVTTRKKVAIIGPGAIGLFLGSAFARAGCSVTVCAGTPIETISVTEDDSTEVTPVRYTARPADIADHPLAVLAVKAHHTDEAGPWLRAAAGPGKTVLVAQNGIEHAERVAPYARPSAIVPGAVYVNVERTKPGTAIVRRSAYRELIVPADPAAAAVAELLRAGGLRVDAVADFHSAAWSKLLANLGANPVTALTGRRMEVVRDPAVARYVTRLLDEAAAVARADGAIQAEDESARLLQVIQELPDGSTSSMLQDRLAGRSLEYDAITGAVLRAAARHDIVVPQVEALHALIGATSA